MVGSRLAHGATVDNRKTLSNMVPRATGSTETSSGGYNKEEGVLFGPILSTGRICKLPYPSITNRLLGPSIVPRSRARRHPLFPTSGRETTRGTTAFSIDTRLKYFSLVPSLHFPIFSHKNKHW